MLPVPARADFRSGNRRAELTAIELVLTPLLADSDGDGLFDEWETAGVKDCDGDVVLDLAGLGATPDHKDVFVELDWLPGAEPEADELDVAKAAFAAAPVDAGGTANPDGEPGIRLRVDTGGLRRPDAREDGAAGALGEFSCFDGADNGGDGRVDDQDSDCVVGDNLGGGSEIELADLPNGKNVPRLVGDADGDGEPDFFEVKAEEFDLAARRLVFHYAISGLPGDEEGDGGAGSCADTLDNDGDGPVDDDDTDDCFSSRSQGSPGDFIVLSRRGATFMHELGHGLGLKHGGDEEDNCKSNYVSVMNYTLQAGIPTDRDGDGVPEEVVLDYSPPRFPGGRGAAPLAALQEDDLDEGQVPDPGDAFNWFRFRDQQGGDVTAPLDGVTDWDADGVTGPDELGVDWDGDGTIDEQAVAANIDDFDILGTGSQAEDCENDASDDNLTGHDDWSNIVMRFRPDPATGGAPPVEDVLEPTEEELEQLDVAFNTTDLTAAKTAAPEPAVAGQPLTYAVTVANRGPNPAAAPEILDTPPPGTVFTDPPEGCAPEPGGALRCPLPPLAVGASTSLELTARLPLAVRCGRGQFATLLNVAEASNRGAPDKAPPDNRATARSRVLCATYEYAAKLVCGVQRDPEGLRLTPGRYGTTVNVHNPNDEETFFFKKLALSFPPAAQEAGEVFPLGLDSLAYDRALKVDCEEIRRRLFDGAFPEGYVEGFLVVQSARPLDVSAVYTTAAIDAEGRAVGHSSIDVERVAERRREDPKPAPDLVVRDVRVDLNCDGGTCKLAVGFEVANIGDGPAGPFDVSVTTSPGGSLLGTEAVEAGLAPGESLVATVSEPVPQALIGGADAICVGADLPADAVGELDEGNNESCLGL